MAKLPISNILVTRMERAPDLLEEILDRLKGEHAIELNLTDNHKRLILWRIGLINGNFIRAKRAVEASDVRQIIESIQSSLDTIVTVLSRPKQGPELLRYDRSEAAFRIANALEGRETYAPCIPLSEDFVAPPYPLDDDRIVSLLSLSCVVKDACERALAELNGVRGRSGRRAYEWYDEFVQLLLEFADIADIDPVVKTDRISGERTGPFIELALAFEQLLLLYEDPAGHSVSMRERPQWFPRVNCTFGCTSLSGGLRAPATATVSRCPLYPQ